MSRGQQAQVTKEARAENQTYNQNAQTDFNTTQNDINDYSSAVGAFKSANPYVQGGQAQTVENQQLSDTAAGGAQAAGQAIQSAAVRTGQNAGGAIAATENIAEQNDRNLAGQESQATQQRLAADTGYQEAGLAGTSQVASMQDQLANQQAQAAQGALGTQEQAAQTPGFWDQLTGEVISGAAKVGAAAV